MAKASLSALAVSVSPLATPAPAAQTTAPPPISVSHGRATPDAQTPRYLSLVRKDIRLREDQLEAIAVHARRLSRAKRGGERLTENTLIRVAIDLLLDRIDRASGVTEDEIRASLR